MTRQTVEGVAERRRPESVGDEATVTGVAGPSTGVASAVGFWSGFVVAGGSSACGGMVSA